MICSQCGNNVADQAAACPGCGAQLNVSQGPEVRVGAAGGGSAGHAAAAMSPAFNLDLKRLTRDDQIVGGATLVGEAVTEPIRLHVTAKRYLCTVEPGYVASLSPASVYSLGVQGGPMQRAELAEFEANWYAAAAIRLRRWDDMAKDPAVQVPGFDHYTATLRAVAR